MTPCLVCGTPFDATTDYQGGRLNGTRRRYCSRTCRLVVHNARGRAPRTVDDVAVERACKGDHGVTLNRAELTEAFRILYGRGMSAAVIADRLGVTTRSAERHRPKRAPKKPTPARKDSPAMPASGWSVNQKAATVIKDHALHGGDCQALLETCGLVPEGLEVVRRSDVLPDDTRNYDVEGTAPDSGSTIGWRKVAPEPRADRRHVPPGLSEAS